jgi:hypothetical protein
VYYLPATFRLTILVWISAVMVNVSQVPVLQRLHASFVDIDSICECLLKIKVTSVIVCV